jgi:hypothetical protein
MKIRLHALFFTLIAAFAMAEDAAGQDAGMSDVEIVEDRDRVEHDKLNYSPGEAEVRYIPKATTRVAKDSVAAFMPEMQAGKNKVEPVGKPAEKQQTKHQDDSILSFNFLYYIIQKYKLQDIID